MQDSQRHRRTFLRQATGLIAGGAAANARQAPAQPSPAAKSTMFEGFQTEDVRTSGATIRAVRAGQGPPLLLLHGYPQTHIMWHKLAPTLATEFTVVAADLRGYGDSSKPKDG